MNDAEFPGEPLGDGPVNQPVETDQFGGMGHRCKGFVRMAVLEGIDVGAGEQDDQRLVGVPVGKLLYRVRRPPRMDGDHHIGACTVTGFGNLDPVTKVAQDTRPSDGRGAISRAGLFPCGGDEANLHDLQLSEES